LARGRAAAVSAESDEIGAGCGGKWRVSARARGKLLPGVAGAWRKGDHACGRGDRWLGTSVAETLKEPVLVLAFRGNWAEGKYADEGHRGRPARGERGRCDQPAFTLLLNMDLAAKVFHGRSVCVKVFHDL